MGLVWEAQRSGLLPAAGLQSGLWVTRPEVRICKILRFQPHGQEAGPRRGLDPGLNPLFVPLSVSWRQGGALEDSRELTGTW